MKKRKDNTYGPININVDNTELFNLCSQMGIEVKQDGKSVVITDHIGKKFKATCHPDDEFNFFKGLRIAIEKMNEYYYKYTGKIICIYTTKPKSFTTGKIYRVDNGFITDNNGDCYNSHNPISNFKEFESWKCVKFIEYKGEY